MRPSLICVFVFVTSASIASQGIPFGGLTVQPIGGAIVTPATNGNGDTFLQVTGLGGGQSGASIRTWHLDGVTIELDSTVTGIPLPVGTQLRSRPFGGPNVGVPLGPLTLTRSPTAWDVTLDRSPVSPIGYSFELYLGDVMVHAGPTTVTSPMVSWSPSVEPRVLNVSGLLLCLLLWVGDANFQDEITLTAPTMIHVDGVAVAVADRVRLLTHAPSIPQTLHRVRLEASGLPALGISGLGFQDLGARGRVLGNASVTSSATSGANLTINGIGSSGQDGVALRMTPVRRLGVGLDAQVSPLPTSAAYWDVRGRLPGMGAQTITSFTVSNTPAGWQLDTDPGLLQPIALRIELYASASLAFPPIIGPLPGPWPCIIIGMPGQPGPCFSHQVGVGTGILPSHTAEQDFSFTHEFGQLVSVTVATGMGSTTVMADALRVVAEGTEGQTEWIEGISLRVRDFSTVQVHSLQAEINSTLLHPAANGTFPTDSLTVAGSVGGLARRVDIGVGQAFTIALNPPPGSGSFALFGKVGAANDWDVTDYGSFSTMFPLSIAEPADPSLFLLASDAALPGTLIPSPAAPFSLSLTNPGASPGAAFTLQALVANPAVPGGLSVSNALIVVLL